MDSLWSEISLPRFESLQGEQKTDVLIIGGGMTGLLCAHQLKAAGVDCILVEAERICAGTTRNTTAKITAQHGLIYHKLLKRFGLEKARLYLQANEEALAEYRRLCSGMDCDFVEKSNVVYSLDDGKKVEQELWALEKLGYSARGLDKVPLPFGVAGAVEFPNQAQFHPLKFAAELAKGLPIYKKTKVRELKPGQAVCNGGSISAKHIIVATHFPILNKHGGYFLKIYQHRSYVLALKNAADVGGMYVDESKTGLSFRNQGDLLLLGGGGHRTGKQGGNWRELSHFAREHYPGAREVCRWAAQDCMTLDDVPYIGLYSKGTRGLYVASGYNKWGMSSSMAAARLLCDMVQGRENPCAKLFDPSRSMLHPQLALNAAEATLNLLTPTVPRCPHLGCALKYNPQERSWDCPCHGSRFSEGGQLLEGPSTDDMKK